MIELGFIAVMIAPKPAYALPNKSLAF